MDTAVVWREEQRERKARWTTSEQLLALAVEKIHQVVQVTYASIPRKPGQYRPIPPLHIPRPGEPTGPRTVSPAALARAMTGRH